MPAQRKALACKRGKRLPPSAQLSKSERREGLNKLKAIKTKHAAATRQRRWSWYERRCVW